VHYSLTHGAELFLRSRQLCSHSRTSQRFMESGGSLPCSWVSSIQSILTHEISLNFILILSTQLRLSLPSGLFPAGFPPISYMHSSSTPFVLCALPISYSLTW
jgi:hypothetical protein